MTILQRALRTVIFVAAFACSLSFAEYTWTWSVGCPESGAVSPLASFTATTNTGFSASGLCGRISTGFSKFAFSSYNSTPNATTSFALNAGDFILLPPVLPYERRPVLLTTPRCPVSARSLNWIVAQWNQLDRTLLSGIAMMGLSTYDPSTGLAVSNGYDVTGTLLFTGPLAMPGSCSNGVYSVAGSGDRGGSLYLTTGGSGYYVASSRKAFFFFPVYNVSAATEFGSKVFSGLSFDSTALENTKNVRVTANAAGTTWTIDTYDNAETGTIDPAYTDTVTISAVNSPSNGFLRGTYTRTGAGAGTGNVACIVNKGVSLRIACAAESPADNTIPTSLVFSEEGPHIFGKASGTSFVVETGLNTAENVYSDGTRLFVADTVNNRVLIWNTLPTANQPIPDVVLGQPDKVANIANNGGRSASSLSAPRGVYSDGTRVFVADTTNNRVLIWNSIPTVNKQAADLVLGQATFTTATANLGGRSAISLSGPQGLHGNGTQLVVADTGNHRTLIWNTLPTVTRQAADVLVGQPDMAAGTANNGGISGQTLNGARGVAIDGTKLYVADTGNHRALIWNTIPLVNNAVADVALGQPNMTALTANNGGRSAQTLNGPYGISRVGSGLYIADTSNNRVLAWNAVPTVIQTAADFAVGQTNLTGGTANSGGRTGRTLNSPRSVTAAGAALVVADSSNHRALVWNALPSASNALANVVIGQPDMAQGVANNGGVSATTFNTPLGVHSDGTRLFMADSVNNRVLIWNSIPTGNLTAADVVLGQPDMVSATANNGGRTAQSLSNPQDVYSNGTKLYVVDAGNHRVLIWNTIPTVNQTAADMVLGQADMVTGTANSGGRTAQSLSTPYAVESDGTNLFVADGGNHRVLQWTSIPTVNRQAANLVLGQADFITGTTNTGGRSASTMNSPRGVQSDGSKLLVSDNANNRVLIWNSIPASNGQAADVVLGQPDMTVGTANNGGRTAQSLSAPTALRLAGSKLLVADTSNNRVLVWSSIPTVTQTAAVGVLGQTNFTGGTANSGGLTAQTLSSPRYIGFDGTRAYVSDTANNRILSFEIP